MLPENFLENLDSRVGEDFSTPIVFTVEELKALSQDDADEINTHYNAQALMKLPTWEVEFFEWVKREDPPVWEDLWAADAEPYIVGIGFLPAFIESGHGFPICDLVAQDNYYFHKDFVINPDGTNLVGLIVDKIGRHEQVSANEVFLLEVMQHPIDIWRYAYKYNLPLDGAKQMARAYAEDGVILHLTKTDEIGEFMEL